MQKTFKGRASAAALLCGTAVAMMAGAGAAAPAPKLTRNPSLSLDSVAFLHADDIWIAPRNGGTAIRLTTDGKARGGPIFSPDGQEIAYTAQVGGNSTDIFVVPAKGGTPRRVTWHPDPESLTGWTPDGKDVVFASARAIGLRNATQLFTAAADGGGAPRALPLPVGQTLSYSPDGTKAAYTPLGRRTWKGYRGGTVPYIWIADLSTLDVVKVPHTDASDWNPMWIGGKVYFLSDRDGPIGLYAFDVAAGAVTRVLENTGAFAFQSAQAGPGGIVVDAFDSLKLFDPATGKVRAIPVKIPEARFAARKVDLPGRRAVTKALSPDGATYAIEARGEIFLAPNAPDAKARNITNSSSVAERAPIWSPDGKRLAHLSDASGEYRLVVRTPDGTGKPQVFALGAGHGVFTDFTWSPDGGHIAYADETATLWALDLATGQSAKIAHDIYGQGLDIGGWSPDGRTLTYVARNRALVGVIWLYDVATGKSAALTDGRADAFSPAFDPAGGKVYFLASADKPMSSTGSMASNGVPYTAGAYAADLSDPARPVFQRLPAPPRQYRSLQADGQGAVYLGEGEGGEPHTVWRVAAGKTEAFLGDVESFELVMGGTAALVRRNGEDALVRLADVKPGAEGRPGTAPAGQTFATPALPVTVDPRAEWSQIYHEAWRLQRDLFYAGHYNGLDIVKAEARYAPFVAGVDSRSDLTYLLREAFSELRVSHMNVADPPRGDPSFGPEAPAAAELKTAGLLGADYAIEGGRYRIKRIYRGDIWLSEAPGPLAQPGVDVKEGDYLIAVGGKELHADDNLDRALEGAAGKPVEIKVSADPSGADARTYKVTPVGNEFAIRHAGWIGDNRRKVDALSGGKIAYVYVINTADEGYRGFNTQYLSQTDKAGVVVDERNNGGGPIADFIVERLKRQPLVQVWPRYAETSQPFPADFIDGPAAMIVNENAGSGGDILPYMFRKAKAGPIVGKRTWGGTVGGGPSPSLLDGATMVIPHFPISDPDGTWGGLEGNGVAPDIVVDQDPKLVAAGHDPQLEAAVRAVMDQLAVNPPKLRKPPPSRETVKGGHGG